MIKAISRRKTIGCERVLMISLIISLFGYAVFFVLSKGYYFQQWTRFFLIGRDFLLGVMLMLGMGVLFYRKRRYLKLSWFIACLFEILTCLYFHFVSSIGSLPLFSMIPETLGTTLAWGLVLMIRRCCRERAFG